MCDCLHGKLTSCVFISLLHVFESAVDAQAAPEKRLEDMMRLGELCIEVLQQNDEHHSEVFCFLLIYFFLLFFLH